MDFFKNYYIKLNIDPKYRDQKGNYTYKKHKIVSTHARSVDLKKGDKSLQENHEIETNF